MKKLIKLLILSVAVVFFTGCGGVTDDTAGSTSVNIYDLTYGYSIQGTDSNYNSVELVYCGSSYDYYRGSSHFYGYFEIDGSDIVMSDYTDGGRYRLDSYNGLIEEGYNYYVNYPYDITVSYITQINC